MKAKTAKFHDILSKTGLVVALALGCAAVSGLAVGCGGGDRPVDGGSVPGTDSGMPPDTDAGTPPDTDAGFPPDTDAGFPPDTDGGGPPPVSDPSMPGPMSVSTMSDTVSSSGRAVPVTAYLPEGAGPYPLVVFLPGFQLTSSNYAPLGERLASHGFITVLADPPAGTFSVNHVEMREDTVAVIDWATTALAAPVDSSRIGVSGHSLGGKVATMAAAADSRIGALLGIDPVNGGNPFSGYSAELPDITPSPIDALTIPVGFLGETTNGSGGLGGMACAPTDQNFQTFYESATAAPWAAEWDFTGADHMDFVFDTTGCGFACSACTAGSADEAMVRATTLTLTVAFFDRHLLGLGYEPLLTGGSVPAGVVTRSR